MTVNKWTLGLAAVGLVSLPGLVQAEEKLSPVQSLVSGTTISGYVNASAQWNLGTGNANTPNYGVGNNGQPPNGTKADGFNLDAFSLAIEKPLDATDNWAAGYKAEMVWGADAVWGGMNGPIKQAYISLRAPVGNGIDFKMGQFDTIIGYESFNAGANPNYTRSYGWTMEPTTHQGVLASYQVNKILGIAGGVANTWGPGPNGKAQNLANVSESSKAYMGAVTVTAPESLGFLAGSTLYGGVVNGADTSGANGAKNTYNVYVGSTMNTPIKALKVGAAYDYRFLRDPANPQNPAYQQALAGYISYQITEKLSVHSRTEYAANSGTLSGGAFAQNGSDTTGAVNYGKIFAQTATLQYDLWKNVITRAEFRWDHELDDVNRLGGDVANTGTRGNAYLLALNVIYKF